jgi:hypothetical protein
MLSKSRCGKYLGGESDKRHYGEKRASNLDLDDISPNH